MDWRLDILVRVLILLHCVFRYIAFLFNTLTMFDLFVWWKNLSSLRKRAFILDLLRILSILICFLSKKLTMFTFLCDEKSFQVYGTEPYIRSAENIAFHAALFVAKNGSYINYYMVTKLKSLSNNWDMIIKNSPPCFNTVPWWNKLWKDFIFIFHYRILRSSSSRRIRFGLKLLNILSAQTTPILWFWSVFYF